MATKIQPAPTALNSINQAGKTIYLNNKELLAELKISRANDRMSDALAKMLQLLCSKYSRLGKFVNYSFNEDMQAYAMMMLVRTWKSFNPEKGSNPFAFFTQCIKHSFIQYLNQESRLRDVRDLLLIKQGLNPSYGFEQQRGVPNIEDERDYDTMKGTYDALNTPVYNDDPIERDDKGVEIVPVEVPVKREESEEAEKA